MDKVEMIRNHPIFIEQMAAIAEDEKDRVFCGHGIQHLIDVARIATIISRDSGLDISRELIYSAALLHDLGRHMQYSKGIPHNEAGTEFAELIMRECGFDDLEISMVTDAIRNHRKNASEDCKDLADVLYRADKKSRACYSCSARCNCNWPEEKMNLRLDI